MNATRIESVGEPLARLSSVRSIATTNEPFGIEVRWKGKTEHPPRRARRPRALHHEVHTYRPLRHDPALFASVRVIDGGAAIAWGEGQAIGMTAAMVAELSTGELWV
jgi:hypothetical protein